MAPPGPGTHLQDQGRTAADIKPLHVLVGLLKVHGPPGLHRRSSSLAGSLAVAAARIARVVRCAGVPGAGRAEHHAAIARAPLAPRRPSQQASPSRSPACPRAGVQLGGGGQGIVQVDPVRHRDHGGLRPGPAGTQVGARLLEGTALLQRGSGRRNPVHGGRGRGEFWSQHAAAAARDPGPRRPARRPPWLTRNPSNPAAAIPSRGPACARQSPAACLRCVPCSAWNSNLTSGQVGSQVSRRVRWGAPRRACTPPAPLYL